MKENALMSIKELAELVGSVRIRFVGRPGSGVFPSSREGTAYRFDWEKVRQAMRDGPNRCPIDGATRPARQPAMAGGAQLNRPRSVTRGH